MLLTQFRPATRFCFQRLGWVARLVLAACIVWFVTACDEGSKTAGAPTAPGSAGASGGSNTSGPVVFARDIQPILNQSCVRCHKARGGGGGGGPGGPPPGFGGTPPGAPGATESTPPGGPPRGGRGPGGGGPGGGGFGPGGGLRLDDRASAMKGGKHGAAIVAGDAKKSLLYQTLNGPVQQDGHEIPPMPKAKPREEFRPLPADQIELIGRWIDQGAEWPEALQQETPASAPAEPTPPR